MKIKYVVFFNGSGTVPEPATPSDNRCIAEIVDIEHYETLYAVNEADDGYILHIRKANAHIMLAKKLLIGKTKEELYSSIIDVLNRKNIRHGLPEYKELD